MVVLIILPVILQTDIHTATDHTLFTQMLSDNDKEYRTTTIFYFICSVCYRGPTTTG